MTKSLVNTIKRRPARSWSSFSALRKSTGQRRRVKAIQLRISRHKVILFKCRTFKTDKQRRSKHSRQWVIPIAPGKFKEVAINVQRSASVKLQPTTYTFVVRVRPAVIVNYTLILMGLVGAGVFGYRMTRPELPVVAQQVASSVALPTPQPKTDYSKPVFMSRSEPVRLEIPRIAVDANIISVGRLADGTMETPVITSSVAGWYHYSPTPGQQGPSIIVGHVDTYEGPSIFWRLHELVAGDTFEVVRADGSVAGFVVTSVQQFEQASFPTAEVYGDTEYAGIRLITCGGTFNHQTGHYTQNTVVFGTLKE